MHDSIAAGTGISDEISTDFHVLSPWNCHNYSNGMIGPPGNILTVYRITIMVASSSGFIKRDIVRDEKKSFY